MDTEKVDRFSSGWVNHYFEDHWKNFPGYTKFGFWLKIENLKIAFRMLEKIQLKKEASILDFGCGEGATLTEFRKRGFINSVGIDNCPSSIKLCEKRGYRRRVDVFFGDGIKFAWKKKFDLIFADGVLEHFKEIDPLVKSICQNSKKYILLVQPDNFSLGGRLFNFANILVKRNVEEIDYKKEKFVANFSKYGFDLEDFKKSFLGEMTYLLFSRKQKLS